MQTTEHIFDQIRDDAMEVTERTEWRAFIG
jgi:hypothetical protein